MGFSSFLMRFIINSTILILFITFMPGLLPDVSITKSYKIIKETLDGKLTPNKKLDKVEAFFKGDLLGPESFADDENYLYTSLHTGDIVKISGKHIVPVVKFGKPCKGAYQEQICGRPLGLRFGNDGYLYAADAYYGIFKVDVNTGDKIKLVSFGEEIEGKTAKIPNSVAVSCNGDVYWTDSSSNFLLHDGLYALLDDPSGRLIHYNAKTGKNKVLLDGILFSNGVALSKNEDFVIVSDSRNQIVRHYLHGEKAGTTDTFVRLPGFPDNIQTDGGSGFLVSVVLESNVENPSVLSALSQFPNVRRFIARSLSLAELGFRLVDKLYPNEICQKTVHYIGHFTSVINIIPSRSVVLHVSEKGEILDTLWTNNSTIRSISEAHIVMNQLYLGSPFNDYIGRIPLSEVGWKHLSKKTDSLTAKKQLCSALYGEVKPKMAQATTAIPKATVTPKLTTTSTTQKPTTTQTPEPTTTTPKPTTTAQKAKNSDQKPTNTLHKPAATAQKSTSTAQKSASTAQKSTTPTPKPTTTTQIPTKTQKPSDAAQKPTTTAQKSTTPTPKPTTTTQIPTKTQKPSDAAQKPISTPTAASAKSDASATQKPAPVKKEEARKEKKTSNPQINNSEIKKSANSPKNEL